MKYIKLALSLLIALVVSVLAGCQSAKKTKPSPKNHGEPAGHLTARPTTDEVKKSVIYQLMIQNFTNEGTFKKAMYLLPHIKSTGANIVYLCPIVEADDDTDQNFWSNRQKKSKLNNPKNPYRMKDYFKLEPAFGTEDDFKAFVAEAHKLGLKVILDLVYYHCGPKATFIKDHPNFVVRDKYGNVENGRWCFPELNFKDPELREYLWQNMEYFIKKFDVDGYRTDVEFSVPADFWAEGYKRIKKIKPDVFMLAESERPSSQVDAYDACYSFKWTYAIRNVYLGRKPAKFLRESWESQMKDMAKGSRLLRCLDNHDTVTDSCTSKTCKFQRFEKTFGHRGIDSVLVLNYTIDGIPMLWSGNEFVDDSRLSLFSTPKYGRLIVGWENLSTKCGQARMKLVKKLAEIRRANPALWKGATKWIDNTNEKSVISFTRKFENQEVLVVINTTNAPAEVEVKQCTKGMSELLKYGCQADKNKFKLQPYGYIVLKK